MKIMACRALAARVENIGDQDDTSIADAFDALEQLIKTPGILTPELKTEAKYLLVDIYEKSSDRIFVNRADSLLKETLDVDAVEVREHRLFKETLKPHPDFLGENFKGVFGFDMQYMTDAEREECRLTVADGKLMQHGKPFDTTGAANAYAPEGKAIYVMTEQGDIYATKHWPAGIVCHASFMAGSRVAAAGQMEVADGKVVLVDRASGHILPERKHLQQFVSRLKSLGINHEFTQEDF